MGGIVATAPGVLSSGSNQHALALFPASETELSPPMDHSAMFVVVLNTGTSRPMRSDTEYNRFVGSAQLISKILNGPPGSPLGLCSGTIITLISPIVPFLSVPQTGQLGVLPQLFVIKIDANSATRARRCDIFGFIESPPTIFPGGRTSFSTPFSGRSRWPPWKPAANGLTRAARKTHFD